MKKAVLSIIIASFCLFPARANAISAESCILIDADSGKALYEYNADNRMLIASTTKIMTALVALEKGDLKDEVRITKDSCNVEGSSMYLKQGDTITLEQLIYGMMLVSGNDAASAVAYHIAGSIEAFAELMNDKAAELRLKNTSFTNPHGLDHENHYSTARDMAIIMQAAMENKDFVRITSTKSITIDGITYTNHNKLLSICEGITGGKTGYTKAAGRTLVSSCQRNGMSLICVTLNDPDDWDDHIAIYEQAFQEYERVTVADSGAVYAELPVIAGEDCDTVKIKPAETVTVTVKAESEIEITNDLPRFVYAEITEGEKAGTLTWTVNGETAGEVELVYAESAEREEPEDKGFFEELKEKFMGFVEFRMNKFGYYGS
ncbi:MAG: D-alanyl-D-alanine carboxypeptidase [Ruminococcaceae bacterium]|nr:D-alanyl-D-alanine carboxypeptidase [Oscillospiraceae bacterium]